MLHGALLDARLLAEAYLAMTRGQESLIVEEDDAQRDADGAPARLDTSQLVVLRATPAELAAHDKLLDGIEKEAKHGTIWRMLAARE
jgi:DNA polymerase-3 subunit epsilon